MAANLVWGKGFTLERTPLPSGETYDEVFGIDGDCTSIAWSSVAALEEVAERYGERKASRPIYRDCEVDADVPLEDAQRRRAEVRIALETVPADVIENDYWLSVVVRLLRQGNGALRHPFRRHHRHRDDPLPPAPASTLNVVSDLNPNTSYAVTTTADATGVTVQIGPGAGSTTSAAGVLTFTTPTGGR